MLNAILTGVLVGVTAYNIKLYNELRKEKKDMAVVYCTLIVKGLKTIDDVPEKIRKQVEELLEALEV